jgi:Domain of unknown function (DUF4177)
MRRWQYKVVQQRVLIGIGGADPEEDRMREAMLDRYGSEGWELVAVAQQSYRREYDPTAMQGYSQFSYFFNRETPAS